MLRTDFTSLKELQEVNIAVISLTSISEAALSKINASLNSLRILSHESLSLQSYIAPIDQSNNPFPLKEGYFHTMVSRHFNFALWDKEMIHVSYQHINFTDLLSHLDQRRRADEMIAFSRQNYSAYDLHKSVLPEGSMAVAKEHSPEPYTEDISVCNINPSRRWHGILFLASLNSEIIKNDENSKNFADNRKKAIKQRYADAIKTLTRTLPISNGDGVPICSLPSRLYILDSTDTDDSLEYMTGDETAPYTPKEVPVIYSPAGAAITKNIDVAAHSLVTSVAFKLLMRICSLTYGNEDYMALYETEVVKLYPHLLHSRCGAARQQKIVGDICLLLGCYKDAQIAYQNSLNMFVYTAADIRARSKHKYMMTELPVPPELVGVPTMAYPSENDFTVLETDTIWLASALEGSATSLALAEFTTSFAKLADHVTGAITDRLHRAAWIFNAKKFYFCSAACTIKSTSVSRSIGQQKLAMISSNAVLLSEYMTHVPVALAARIFQNLSIITSMPRYRALYSLFAAQNWLLLNEHDTAFKCLQRSFKNFKCPFLISGLLLDTTPQIAECLQSSSEPTITDYLELPWDRDVSYEPPKMLPKIYPYQTQVIRLARLAKQTSQESDFYDYIEALTLNSATNPRGSGSRLVTVSGLVNTLQVASETEVVVSEYHDKVQPQADYIYRKNRDSIDIWCREESYLITIDSSRYLSYTSIDMLLYETKPFYDDDCEPQLFRVPLIYHGDLQATIRLPEEIPVGIYKIISINGFVGTCPSRCLLRQPVELLICESCPKIHQQCSYNMALFERTSEEFDGQLHLKNYSNSDLELDIRYLRSVPALKIPKELRAFQELSVPIKITEDSEMRIKSSIKNNQYPYRLNCLKIIDEKLFQLNFIRSKLDKLIASYSECCSSDIDDCNCLISSMEKIFE